VGQFRTPTIVMLASISDLLCCGRRRALRTGLQIDTLKDRQFDRESLSDVVGFTNCCEDVEGLNGHTFLVRLDP